MTSEAQPKKAMLWFEGHLGAGDARLSFNLADGLARNGYEVYIASSSVKSWQHIFKPNPHIHIIDLPPLERRQDQVYYTPDDTKFPGDKDYVKKRTDVLLEAFEGINPDLMVTQSWPIGRNEFDEEMLSLMETIKGRAHKPVLACYPIDVNYVTMKENGRQNRRAQIVEQLPLFDKILIPGTHMLDYTQAIPEIEPFKDKLAYAGYFVDSFDTQPKKQQDEVLVCSGGGWHNSDLPFYLAAIKSRKFTEMKDDFWRIKVSNKLCPPEMYQQIIEAAKAEDPTGTSIIVEPADNKFQQQMVDAKLVVIRSGYNTLTEAVHAAKHVVTIPRPYKGFDREQQARAEALENSGYVRMVKHDELEEIVQTGNYESMAKVMDAALHDDLQAIPPLDTKGADNAALIFSDMIDKKRSLQVTQARGALAVQGVSNERV